MTPRRVSALVALLAAGVASSCSNPRQENHGLYLDLMKLSLCDLLYENDPAARQARTEGSDWPSRAMTMIGLKRLDNLHVAIEDVLAKGVPGDFIETGAWRGGACIFMRAVLKAHGVTDRTVWVADSFEGLPRPNPEKYPADTRMDYSDVTYLAVSLDLVKQNFARYGLLDGQVQFLKGWFRDTLPTAPIERLAILRLDGDLYESTMDALVNLYPKVPPGGWVIIDDYGAIPACAQAVTDYRMTHSIEEPLVEIDWTGVYWIKR